MRIIFVKYKLLCVLISLGFVLTFTGLFSLVPNCGNEWKIVLQIVSSLGGGLFTSALVSLFIENGNDRRAEKKRLELKEYLLSEISDLLTTILCFENRFLSQYVAIINHRVIKMQKKEETFSNLLDYAHRYLKAIDDYLFDIMEQDKKYIHIADDWVEQNNKKEKLLFKDMCFYYERLKSLIGKIIEKKEQYLMNEMLTQENFKVLEDSVYSINELILYCGAKETDFILEYKSMVLHDIEKIGNFVIKNKERKYLTTQAI